jgi:perosamine synthetase
MIPYGKQSIDESDIEPVGQVLRSDFLTTGPAVELFERKLCELTGARYAVACSNGTAALHLACLALGIGKGNTGITSPITFLASANCVEFCGGAMDFVDIDPDTLCLSTAALESYCKDHASPTVVIPVDFAGVPADLPGIWTLAQKYGFKVIEDAAHAIGSTYTHDSKELQCGCCAHSDMAIFSFHPVKTITTGEGGVVLTNDSALAKRLRRFRNHGMTKDADSLSRNDGPWYYEMHELGFNYRITDLQCALGISQMNRLGVFKKRRQEIVAAYNKAFSDHPDLIIPPWPSETSPCFHLYALQFAKGDRVRKRVYEILAANGVLPQVHYIPVYRQPYYQKKYGYRQGKCPAAETYYFRCLSLPLYPALTDSDVNKVIGQVMASLR